MGNDNATDEILSQFSQFISLVLEIGVVVGIGLVGTAIYGFYHSAAYPQKHPMSQNIFFLLAGTMLISSSHIFQIFDNTMLPQNFQHDIVQSQTLDQSALYLDESAVKEMVKNGIVAGSPSSSGVTSVLIPERTSAMVIAFMYLVGVISFIKGIYILKDAGDVYNKNESPVMKSIIHMVAGVIAVNLNQFGCIVGNTFGTTLFCSMG